MEWTCKIRQKSVRFTVLDDVRAIRPTKGLLDTAGTPSLSFLFADAVSDKAFASMAGNSALPRRRRFSDAGWHFIHPSRELTSARIRDAIQDHHVYATDEGRLMIGTKLATVQLPADMTESQAMEALKSDGLQIVYKLGFAPNLFEVKVPDEPSYPQVLDGLQSKTAKYLFVEPSLLQTITGRETPAAETVHIDLAKQWHHGKPPTGLEEGPFGINSLDAWGVTKGRFNGNRPVRVAVIDNGMQISHPDIRDAIIGGGFFSPVNGNSATPTPVALKKGMKNFPEKHMDHGTFCMGMVGARLNGDNTCGCAPEADLIAIACAHDQTTTQTTLARAIDFAVNPTAVLSEATPAGGADVISCSLATGVFQEVLAKAIESAAKTGRNISGKSLGTPIFWAVDNLLGPIADSDVCAHEGVIAVGCSSKAGLKFPSASGARLEFLAPGESLLGIVADSTTNINQGTSFATPLAAGVAALVLSINPNLDVQQLRELLQKSCEPPGQKRTPDLGFGILNSANAVQRALESRNTPPN